MNLLAATGFNQPRFNCSRIITVQKIWIMLIEIPNNYFRQLNKAIGQILTLQPEMQVTWQKINK